MLTSRKKIDYWLDIEDSREKIDNWLNVEDSSKKIDTIDLLIEFSSLITMNWLTFKTRKSTIDCHYRWFTIILADSRCVKWKWDSIMTLKERTSSLTQIHDHFRWFTMRIMKVRCIHRLQRQNFVVCLSRRTWSIWQFYLITRVFRRAIFAEFNRIIVSLANSVREIVLKTWRWSRHRHCWKKDFVLKMKSSRIERSCFFLLVDQLIANVKFTSFVTMKIKYNVRRRVWLKVTITKTWTFDLKSKYVHENRTSKVEMCVKLTLVLIWTFADKIRLNRNFFQDMLVTRFIIDSQAFLLMFLYMSLIFDKIESIRIHCSECVSCEVVFSLRDTRTNTTKILFWL